MKAIKNITVFLFLLSTQAGQAQVRHMAMITAEYPSKTIAAPAAGSSDNALKRSVLSTMQPAQYIYAFATATKNTANEKNLMGKLMRSSLRISFQLKSFKVNISYL